MEKMTNKKALEFVLSLEVVANNVEVHAKLLKMLEQVEKKSNSGTSTGKMTKAQIENDRIKSNIVESMHLIGKPIQIKEMLSLPAFCGYSSQKMSALVKQLCESGIIERIEEKKVAKFRLVSAPVDTILQLSPPVEEILDVDFVEISDNE